MGGNCSELTSLQAVLQNVAEEIGNIGSLASQVEHSLFEWLVAMLPDSQAPASLQDLDLLIQKLEELSSFLARVSGKVAFDEMLDLNAVVAPIKLAALRESLMQRDGDVFAASKTGSPDDVEFF